MSDRPIRILLVDDHALFRHGLRQLLATTDDLVVVGEAATGRQALELVARLRPDVVLMDIAMPDLDGLLATQALHRQFPELRIVMLTMYEAMTYGAAARAAGASAYVVKSSHPDDLFAAIRAAANGAAHRPNGVDTPTLPEHARLPEDRMAHLERRVQWLESQWAVLAARHAAATQPEAPAVSQPAPDDVRSSSEAMPKPASPARQTGASHLFRRMPVAAATTRQAPTVVPRSSRQLPPWLFVGATLLAAAIASAGLLAPPPLAALGRWIALLAGIAVAALLATYAAVRNARPVLAHLLLLLALGTALAWSLAVSWREPLPLRGLGLGSLVLVALLVLALAWRRGFLLAAAFALAIVSVAPFALAFPLSRLALLWVTATVGAATSLAWRRLDGDGTPVAWEWLPLAPLSAGLPLVLPWHEHSDAPYLFLLGIPWLALVPVLWRATRLGRGSVTAVFLVAALSYLGTFGWRLSRTPPATQAAALALVAGAFALLALLLRQAGQGRSPRPAPWETAAGLAGLALATSAARHPDPVLAP
ncbi:MAG: response regulator, partial [Thermomicrobium sp.]|nr:response regulator [Thermomicrobium sp.]